MSHDPLDLVLSKLQRVKKSGAGYKARCPAHDDREPSLSITTGDKKQVLLKCHTGCAVEDIVNAIGISMSELFPDHGDRKSGRRPAGENAHIVAVYDYVDADGEILYQNVRFKPKDFKARRPDGHGGWTWSLGEVDRVPFNLPALLSRSAGEPIYFCEGEKDALLLKEHGLIATCHKSLGGEGWRVEWNAYIEGSPAFVLRDNDHTGIDLADKAAATLHTGGVRVTIVALPGLDLHGDVSDWFAQGGSAEELREIAQAEPVWRPESDSPPVSAIPLCPLFPTDTLPPAMRALCEEASQSFGYPADYVALPALAVVGTMAGGSVELHLKPGWFERAVGWFIQIGEPGSAKSPAQDLALAPVQAIQRELFDHYKTLSDNYFDQPKNERKGEPPELEVLITTDTTIEGVARHHVQSLLIAPDELTAWLAGFNRYRGGGASERGQWLSSWALTQVMVTRASKGATIIPRPTVNVTGGIQPDRLRMLLQDAKGDSMNDGFLDRLLPCWPTSDPPEWTEDAIDPRTLKAWEGLVSEIRTVRRYAPDGDALKVRIDERAKPLWRQWYNANTRSTKAAIGMGRGWSAKAPRHLLRLSLALHIASNPEAVSHPLSLETLEAGIELTDWFRGQHGLMLSALGAGESSKQAGITTRIKRILSKSGETWMRHSDLYKKLRNVQSDALAEAIATLIEEGVIDSRTVETSTKPRDEYRVRTFSFSHYSQNPTPRDSPLRPCPGCNLKINRINNPHHCPSCGLIFEEAA